MTAPLRGLLLAVLLNGLLCVGVHAAESEILVLMHSAGRVERYELATGQHLGTLLSGLPKCNAILPDPDGRLLISTGALGETGTVLRFDPRGSGRVDKLIDVPEGYGGRLFRATGMAWFGDDLLVASQGDGKVKRYAYPSGEWIADAALAAPGGITQIAVHRSRLYLTDFVAQALRKAPDPLDGSMSEVWAKQAGHAPWGAVFDGQGHAFLTTSAHRILRFDGRDTIEWAGAGGEVATPVGLALGPDGFLYVANLHGNISVWDAQAPSAGPPIRVIAGPEVQGPISIAFVPPPNATEFAYLGEIDEGRESSAKQAFFESKIRPLLHSRCIDCHGELAQEGQLRLDSRHGWEQGGETGPAIAPGQPENSLLVQAVKYANKDLRMPPDKPLSADEVALLEDWIRQGAVDPRRDIRTSKQPETDAWAEEFQKRLDWWSLRPLGNSKPPVVNNEPRRQQPIDRFIDDGLQRAGLSPAPAAEPEVLLRRLAFVLTGLPPTPAQRERFLSQWAIDPGAAYVALVEEVLASPHYGERFARYWMDVVRYTDTYGYEWDVPAKGAYEYRDYLIRAFNEDIGFDTLLREQLAGDLINPPRVSSDAGINESLIGPMFYHMGEHRHGSSLAYNGVHQEMVNNKIDAFSKVFLATTVACAKCHNHKLEAVSQRDYYALGAVFMTPRWVSRPIEAPGKNDTAIARLKELRTAIGDTLALHWANESLGPTDWRKPFDKSSLPQPPLEAVAYPLSKLLAGSADVEATWNALAREWSAARAARLEHNKAVTVLADFSLPKIPDGWVIDGDGMQHGWVGEATPLIALEGTNVIARMLPAGYHTHSLSSKLPGALRMPPQHLVPGKFVSLELAGGEFAGYLQMDENSILHEGVGTLNNVQSTWRTFADTPMKGGVTKVTIDFVTASLNPNFPARVGVIPGIPAADSGRDKRSWLSITGVVATETGVSPKDTLDSFESLYQGPPPRTVDEMNARVAAWLAAALRRYCDGQSQAGDRPIIDWLLTENLLPNRAAEGSPLAENLAEYRNIEKGIAFPRSVNSMDERQNEKSGMYLNVRGNYDALGELVQPDFLQMFSGRNAVADSAGSGRLELAESLLSPEHPLTSRVYVNRVWQWVFGAGIVRTPDDFGRLGDKPSHSELLDWLARDFVEHGWSTKQLVRKLVLSETFRQSGHVSQVAEDRDPENRLRHHFTTRRMEAEVIRDSLLAVSGRLDPALYGPPIDPPRSAEDSQKRLFSGPLDGLGRRSLYLTMSIMAPPTFLMSFDLPDLRLPTGRRNVTNVPTQALLLLNDPLVDSLAQHWARALVGTPHGSPQERISSMFSTAFSRTPSDAELIRWLDFLNSVVVSSDVMTDVPAWAHLAHALFNAQEFIYYR